MSHERRRCLDGSPLRDFDFATLALTGLEAVAKLWSEEQQSFKRSTIDLDQRLRPTVTFRCADVLLMVSSVRPELSRGREDLIRAVEKRVVTVGSGAVQQASELAYPPFTAALQTLATARVAAAGSTEADSARQSLPSLLDELQSCLPADKLSSFHPFVQEHALRAVQASRPLVDSTSLEGYMAALLRSTTVAAERLLARHHAGLITPAESVVLVFCAAALSTTGIISDDRIAFAALSAAASAQDMSGSWPLGRVVLEDPSRLEISTYEVAWAVADTLTRLLGRIDPDSDLREVETALEAVTRACEFSARSVVELDDSSRGWSSDHPYQQPRIESWTSAIALQFALASETLRDHLRNRDVLGSFRAISPRDANWPSWLRWGKLADSAEPDAGHPVYDYLRRRVIERIEAHPQQLPCGGDETASVLLFGPPGTSKTTIVQAMADRLGWPIVLLSPGAFIEKGLEAIEAVAQSVFARLQELRQVVVIFDECDELFRDRHPDGATEQLRNISAFVTASMLPKLQDLHDRGKVLFVICTNHVDMMDKAVLRGGRIDHRIGVGPPDERARAAIIASFRDELGDKPNLEPALTHLAVGAQRFSRGELKRAALKLVGGDLWPDRDAAVRSAQAVIDDMQEGLTISEQSIKAFRELQRQISDPYLEGS